MKPKEIIEITEKYGAHNYNPLPIVISKAEGVWVEDPEGKRYIDMLSSYSALNQGHRHPRIVKALKEQADKVTLTSRAFHNDQLGPFLKELCELSRMEMALPMNSGAEAVETAIKAARKWGYTKKGIENNKAEIIVCHNNFHGRTTTIVGFSSENQYRNGFGPFSPGFKLIPYGCVADLKAAIDENTAAFLFEPLQGEAGVITPPDGYFEKAYEICKRDNVLFVDDEIQTGLGRTGKMFCLDHEDIKPDMYIIGKALSGGLYPVSAVVSSKEILGVFNPGDHGSTFGGNPLGCAVAREALRVIVEEKLPEKAHEIGHYFMEKLSSLKSKWIDHVRGKGLMIGVVLKEEAGGARRFCEALMEEGLLCKETHVNVIRFAPPLVIKKAEIDWAIGKVKKVLAQP